MSNRKLTLLGNSKAKKPSKLLEGFSTPSAVTVVTMTSDAVTALCPVTGQPDQYTVEIKYWPNGLCIESKSLKLELQSYRQKGIFCEDLSTHIAERVMKSIKPQRVWVKVTQKPRGDVSIVAESILAEPSE